MTRERFIGAIVLAVGIALVEAGAYNELGQAEYAFNLGTLLLLIGFLTLIAGAALSLSHM